MAVDWDKLVLASTTAIFGEAALYIPHGAQPFSLKGIFDEAYREISELDGMPVTTEMPVIGLRVSDFSGRDQPKQGDQLVITRLQKRYVVRDVRRDGHGSVKLLLNYVGVG